MTASLTQGKILSQYMEGHIEKHWQTLPPIGWRWRTSSTSQVRPLKIGPTFCPHPWLFTAVSPQLRRAANNPKRGGCVSEGNTAIIFTQFWNDLGTEPSSTATVCHTEYQVTLYVCIYWGPRNREAKGPIHKMFHLHRVTTTEQQCSHLRHSFKTPKSLDGAFQDIVASKCLGKVHVSVCTTACIKHWHLIMARKPALHLLWIRPTADLRQNVHIKCNNSKN